MGHSVRWYQLLKIVELNKMNCELILTYDTPAYMFNVYKNQLSRQTGSRNLTGPKTLPTIWHTYMKLVTKYQISAINSYLPLPLQGAGFGEREYNNIAKMGIYSSDQKTFLHKDIYQYQGKPHYRYSLFKGDN